MFLPDCAFDTPRGERAKPVEALVVNVGPWRKTKQGFAVLPDFKPGDRVLVGAYQGTKLTRDLGENLRLCNVGDVLAVIDETH